MEAKKFYDIHFHAMDLSHANITAFLNRFINESDEIFNPDLIKSKLKENLPRWKLFLLPLASYSCLARKIFSGIQDYLKGQEFLQKTNRIRNLLSFMESSIMYDFLILEYFLKYKEAIVSGHNEFIIHGTTYNKIVLCPLIMDFGYKNIDNDNIFYNVPPQKPITSQIKDLFIAIETYYNHEITIKEEDGRNKFDVNKVTVPKNEKLFEIYPFMGINPDNYDFTAIKGMLDKYFSDFSKEDTPQERQEKLYKKMGEFNGDLEDRQSCKNIFAGIKFYPPLGFNPWPEDCSECAEKKAIGESCKCNKAKVELLYKTCVDRNIPIITHCSTGGFKAASNYHELTDPGEKWREVLKEYPGLKIDFAHFGSGGNGWQQTIIDHILDQDSKVYTDFSCNTGNDAYYQQLEKTIHDSSDNGLLSERILFGSDFMINMIWLRSYNEYIKYFKDTNHLSPELKVKFCQTNSENFLFG